MESLHSLTPNGLSQILNECKGLMASAILKTVRFRVREPLLQIGLLLVMSRFQNAGSRRTIRLRLNYGSHLDEDVRSLKETRTVNRLNC